MAGGSGAMPSRTRKSGQPTRRSRNSPPTVEEMDGGSDDERTARWRDWDSAWPEFPFRSRSLNKLALHPVLMDLAEGRLCSALTTYASTWLYVTTSTPHQPWASTSSSTPTTQSHDRRPAHRRRLPQAGIIVYLTDVSTETERPDWSRSKGRRTSRSEAHPQPHGLRRSLRRTGGGQRRPRGPWSATGPTSTIDLRLVGAGQAPHHDDRLFPAGRRRVRASGVAFYKGLSPDWYNFVQH